MKGERLGLTLRNRVNEVLVAEVSAQSNAKGLIEELDRIIEIDGQPITDKVGQISRVISLIPRSGHRALVPRGCHQASGLLHLHRRAPRVSRSEAAPPQ